ncbi:MAG: hypothetical protein CO133_01155, partial [Candidatus Komeilibacteria bacterium CG_4_9_14_3_um_filter_37_5]
LAFGSIIILTDDDIYKRDLYCKYDKTYNFKLIHGFTTDTFDILGLITNKTFEFKDDVKENDYLMEYPPYSGYKIKGKPYWYWTKKGIKIDEKDIPKKKVTIKKFVKNNQYNISKNNLIKLIIERINTVSKQTFRQKEIIDEYNNTLTDDQYIISEFTITLTSGGFVRYFGNMMGGTCFDIERTKYFIL